MLGTVLAYGVYMLLKFLGYTFCGFMFRKMYGKPEISAVKVGLARTLLGMVIGGAFTALWAGVASTGVFGSGRDPTPILWYFGALIPVRIGEWAMVLWYFFDRKLERKGIMAAGILLGLVASYAIDIPVAFGIIVMVCSIC